MSWKDDPATSPQLTMLRDLYAYAMGWDKAMGKVHAMKDAKITKGMASEEITRLRNLKAHGQLIEENI